MNASTRTCQTPATPTGCPEPALLLRFISKDLDEDQSGHVYDHVARCEECRQLVSELALSESLLPGDADATVVDVRPDSIDGPKAALFRPGEVIDGKFEIAVPVGHGGMGVVYAARHVVLQSAVALKFLRADVGDDDASRARFLREARAAAQLKSEHIVRVYDVGLLHGTTPYLVMELLAGVDLRKHLATQGVLSVNEALGWIAECCVALSEAHARGIVHRDLKPANLFLAEVGDRRVLKVLDFGISKSLHPEPGLDASGVTTSHAIVGSPLYMAPEQLRGSPEVDTRADLWSLGAILYELLTGRSPFVSESFGALCMDIASGRVPSARAVRPDVPSFVDDAIAACLQVDLERRVPSVSVLLALLAAPAPRREQTRSWRGLGVAMGLVGMVAIAGFVTARGRSSDTAMARQRSTVVAPPAETSRRLDIGPSRLVVRESIPRVTARPVAPPARRDTTPAEPSDEIDHRGFLERK